MTTHPQHPQDGGAAFPRPASPADFIDSCQEGMSLRDWFAGQALAGISPPHAGYSVEGAADRCYKLADAMIAHRARG